MKTVFGDWEIAAIAAYTSGQSITVFTTNIPGIHGGPSGTGYTGNQRPNVTGQSCQADGDLPEQILNPAAFTLNGFRLGTFGTAGRGICTGPDYSQVDLSLLQEHPPRRPREGPAPLRDLQHLQPGQLPVEPAEHPVQPRGSARSTRATRTTATEDHRLQRHPGQLRPVEQHPRRPPGPVRHQAAVLGLAPASHERPGPSGPGRFLWGVRS